MRILLISDVNCLLTVICVIGSFDSAVHISEEASNAVTAVPWAIIWSICVAAIFGTGIPIILPRAVSYLAQKSLLRSGERNARVLHGPRS